MICKHTQFRDFDIWEPRYNDKRVLLASHRIGDHNRVTFTKAKSMGTDPYYLNGKRARAFKKESNGAIDVYSIPLDELKPIEYEVPCEHE